jgi:hypothetical protein
MVAIFMLALAVTSLDSPDHTHVRATEPRILAFIETGIARSATFRQLVDALNQTNVIVYVERKLRHDELGGYLDHNITSSGGFRYIRIRIEVAGREIRLISVLAHELQHAIEVAGSPDAGDAVTVGKLFERLGVEYQCGQVYCFETRAAIRVEDAVSAELKASATH